jgi:PBP1b-binding outer membrane lipoprotein LpoB
MKAVLLLLILFVVACSPAGKKTAVKNHAVPTYFATQKNPSPDTNTYKAGDVEVFKLISGKDTFFFTRMYRRDNGELRSYETTLTGKSYYDEMRYQWLNDSTITFTFIDSKNKGSQDITIMGSGATTAVQ